MNLRPVIVPAKVLTDGKHRIRIGMSHHGATRYFLTRFVVDNPKCISGGMVVGIPNASYINQVLMQTMTEIYKTFDTIDDSEYLSCAQLKARIEKLMKTERPCTLYEVIDAFNDYRSHVIAPSTMAIQHAAFNIIKGYFNEDYQLRQLSADDLYGLREYMTKRGLSETTQHIDFQVFHQMVVYAIRHNKVAYERNPFSDFKTPRSNVRDVAITIEELRRLRDCKFEGRKEQRYELVRDIFMLSFYLCGMNLVDILRLDFSKPYVKYRRQKTDTRREKQEYTEFTIQPEARAILDKYCVNGKFMYRGKEHSKGSYLNHLFRKLPVVAEKCGITSRLIFYSARKTFAQLANELMIKDSIIEYCIGDAVTNSRQVIGSYISINKRIADKAIRRVFDAVASTKSMDELMEEYV